MQMNIATTNMEDYQLVLLLLLLEKLFNRIKRLQAICFFASRYKTKYCLQFLSILIVKKGTNIRNQCLYHRSLCLHPWIVMVKWSICLNRNAFLFSKLSMMPSVRIIQHLTSLYAHTNCKHRRKQLNMGVFNCFALLNCQQRDKSDKAIEYGLRFNCFRGAFQDQLITGCKAIKCGSI